MNLDTTIDSLLKETLIKNHQEWLFEHIQTLNPEEQACLISELKQVPWQIFEKTQNEEELVRQIASAQAPMFVPYELNANQDEMDIYRPIGEQAIKDGKVALLLVAGGLGSRLSFEGPKGIYPARPISKISLFEHFAQKIKVLQRKYGIKLDWMIMTSFQNEESTKLFFQANRFFGLAQDQIHFFNQSGVIAFDQESQHVLLKDRSHLQLYPDGHGGMISAFKQSNLPKIMQSKGVEMISYFQVDNPLIDLLDPLLIGLHLAHASSSREISSKIVEKTDENEKVGLFMSIENQLRLIEYHQIPSEILELRDENDVLKFRCASIAAHIIQLDFLLSCEEDLHIYESIKSLSHFDPIQNQIVTKPGRKFERFIFDLIPKAKKSLIYETKRSQEFAPIKNRQGKDTPESSYLLQSEKIKSWLKTLGYLDWIDALPSEHIIELSPLIANDQNELHIAIQNGKVTLNTPIQDQKILL
jgi:UDP-N-acetylglucosamine/UDP-N-acetylgalactosamine diphosphorylase